MKKLSFTAIYLSPLPSFSHLKLSKSMYIVSSYNGTSKFRFLKNQNLGHATSKCRTMQNTYPSGPILKAGLEGACLVERCLPIPGFHRNGGMLNFCKVLSQLVSIPLLFIAVICVQSALLAPWRKCHLFTLVLISVFTVLAKTIQFIQLKSFLIKSWLLGRLYCFSQQ